MKLENQIPRSVFDKVLEQHGLRIEDDELARQAIIFTFWKLGRTI